MKKSLLILILLLCVNYCYTQQLIGKYKTVKFDILEQVSLHDNVDIERDSLQWINFRKSNFDSINIIFKENNRIDIISPRYNAEINIKYPYKKKGEKNRNIKILGGSFKQFDSLHGERYRFKSVIDYMYGVNKISFTDDSKIALWGYRYPYEFKIYLEKE